MGEELIYDESGFSSGLAIGRKMASRVNVRRIEEIYRNGREFYKNIIDGRGGFYESVKDAYEGFEHSPGDLIAKRPNVTQIWNLPFKNGGFLYGSSLGHVHKKYDFDVQEIYEFANYGGMLISDEDSVKFYICKPRDKIVVKPNCMMTIFNLSYRMLETRDMANPLTNESSKEILIDKKGPMVAVYHSGGDEYFDDPCLSKRFDNRICFPKAGKVEMRLNKNYEQFGIKEDSVVDFVIDSYEGSLVENILENSCQLEKYNIEVLEGKRIIDCKGRDGNEYSLDWPLEDLVRDKDKIVHRVLGML